MFHNTPAAAAAAAAAATATATAGAAAAAVARRIGPRVCYRSSDAFPLQLQLLRPAAAAAAPLSISSSKSSSSCCCCGAPRFFSVLRDPQPLQRILTELAAQRKATDKSSNSSNDSSSNDSSRLREGESGCISSSSHTGSWEGDKLSSETSTWCFGYGENHSSNTSSSSSSRSSSGNNEAVDSEPCGPPLQVHAEVVYTKEQREAAAAADAAAAEATAAAAAQRQEQYLRVTDADAAAAGGDAADLRRRLEQSFEALLPPHIVAAASVPRAAAAVPRAAAAAGAAAATTTATGEGSYASTGTEDEALTPAQRFYRDNRELLLQRAEQYLRGKQAAAAAAAADSSGAAAAAAGEEEEWNDAAETLQEDWRAYFNPVYRQPKGFCWPAVDTPEAAATPDAAAVPPIDMEFRKGKYPSLEEIKCLLSQEGVTGVVCLNLEALGRRDLGLVALVGTCGTAAHCRRVSRMLRSLIASLEIPLVSTSCSSTGGSSRRNRGRRSSSSSEWFVASLGPVSVHLMTPTAREYYAVEQHWSSSSTLQQQEQQEEGFSGELVPLQHTDVQEEELLQQQQLIQHKQVVQHALLQLQEQQQQESCTSMTYYNSSPTHY
ncbi:hypothetical protein Esti_006530 [Eimeria stiedai]